MADPVERFMAFVSQEPTSGCWLWTGSILENGYGQFQVNGAPDKAHRFAFRSFVAPIPSGQCVCHHCDNRACVNPAHLFLGTHAENVADKMRKHREARGEKQGSAKLTVGAVVEIRAIGVGAKAKDLAIRFGVHKSAIHRVRSGRYWREAANG